MERTRGNNKLSKQVIIQSKKKIERKKEWKGNLETMISTGSTLLDLNISGKVIRKGGVPGGVLMELFGPNSSGKTVLLCEMGGDVQRKGGDVLFNDPEARLNKSFASMFDLKIEDLTIKEPDTVTEMINGVRNWKPRGDGKVNVIITDSLAALSTDMEMNNEEGDKMGMRRAKELSEGLRKICRSLKQKNYIMACSNQIRENLASHGEQFVAPGGKATGFYSSIRLRFFPPEKIKREKDIAGKSVKKVIGVKVKVQVYKNSCDAPYRECYLYIIFDYGIDDVRANLQYIKDYTGNSQYVVNGRKMASSIDKAIHKVEKLDLEEELKEQVIDLWEEIEAKFEQKRKPKRR